VIILSLSLLCFWGKSLKCPSTIFETGVEAEEERVEKENKTKGDGLDYRGYQPKVR
jgi:hypothetical protein